VKNFELTAKVRQSGNNSGIQYRSQELKDVGPWSIGGYQCDIHPDQRNNAMLYRRTGPRHRRSRTARRSLSIATVRAGSSRKPSR